MSAPTYSNGKTPQPGDIIAVDFSGFTKFPFIVVAVGQPANTPGAGAAPQSDQTLTAVPFVASEQLNVPAAQTQLWSDYQPAPVPGAQYDNNGRPVTPSPWNGRR